jgi:hypothetical protein
MMALTQPQNISEFDQATLVSPLIMNQAILESPLGVNWANKFSERGTFTDFLKDHDDVFSIVDRGDGKKTTTGNNHVFHRCSV